MRDNHSYMLVINRYPTFMSDIFKWSYTDREWNVVMVVALTFITLNAKGYNDTTFMWHSRFESCQSYKHKVAPFRLISESLDFDLKTLAKITKTPFSRNGHLTYWESYISMCVNQWSISTCSGNHYLVNFTNIDLSRCMGIQLNEMLVWKVWWIQISSEVK